MSAGADCEDFVLAVLEVFRLPGRGTAVVGRVESGAVRTGDAVVVMDGGEVVATARATVEMITSRDHPGIISLLLEEVDKDLLAGGQVIRRSQG